MIFQKNNRNNHLILKLCSNKLLYFVVPFKIFHMSKISSFKNLLSIQLAKEGRVLQLFVFKIKKKKSIL